MFGIVACASILRSAEIIASGFFRQFDAAGVGEKFARARHGEADQHGGAPAQRNDEQGDDDGERRAAIASSPLSLSGRCGEKPNGKFQCGSSDRRRRRKRRRKSPRSRGAERRGCEYGSIRARGPPRASASVRYRVRPRVTAILYGLSEAGSVGVERVALDHLQAGNRHAAGDAEIFEQIVNARRFGARQISRRPWRSRSSSDGRDRR